MILFSYDWVLRLVQRVSCYKSQLDAVTLERNQVERARHVSQLCHITFAMMSSSASCSCLQTRAFLDPQHPHYPHFEGHLDHLLNYLLLT
jgi:phage major head subunit gpT-like protein